MTARRFGFVFVVLLLCGVIGVSAQDSPAGGVVTEGNPAGAENFTTFNPLLCETTACTRITNLLFPYLIGIDLEMGIPGAFGGIAERWEVNYDSDPPSLDVYVRDDLTWSDGTSITAHDALFSFSASRLVNNAYGKTQGTFTQAVLIDTFHIRYIFRDPAACRGITDVNTPIIPAHVFDPNYADTVTTSNTRDFQYDYTYLLTHPFNREPSVTASPVGMRFEDINSNDSIRLISDSGTAYEYVNVPNRDEEIDRFLRGELNFTSNPLFERRPDLTAAAERGEVDLVTYPGSTWYAINFNVASPFVSPYTAFDDDGNPIDQGVHPIFGDVRVRRAVQLGIDVQALIDASVYGYGTVMAANQVPGSWAFNPDLAPVPYDPVEAERLLIEAGWIDENRDGVRECLGCLYANEGDQLVFDLWYPDVSRYGIIISLISQQLSRIGFSVNVNSTDDISQIGELQLFDAVFRVFVESYPVEPDQYMLFTAAGDNFDFNGNYGSYANPEVEALLSAARTEPTCDLNARADLYRQAQVILQEDQPYAWLFVVDQMLAVRAGVENFAPYPQYPFWNLDQWFVTEP